eukprot:6181694-Pleurochrysis_carterae.AAC.1
MWRQDDVLEPTHRRLEQVVAVLLGLLREDVGGAARQVAAAHGCGEGVNVDDVAARGVQQVASALHHVDLCLSDEVASRLELRHVERDVV